MAMNIIFMEKRDVMKAGLPFMGRDYAAKAIGIFPDYLLRDRQLQQRKNCDIIPVISKYKYL